MTSDLMTPHIEIPGSYHPVQGTTPTPKTSMTEAEFEDIVNFNSIEEFQEKLEDYAKELDSAGSAGSYFTASRTQKATEALGTAIKHFIDYTKLMPQSVSLENTRTALTKMGTILTYSMFIQRTAAGVGSNEFDNIAEAARGSLDILSVAAMVGETIALEKRNQASVNFDEFVFSRLTDDNIANILGGDETREFLAQFRKQGSFTDAVEAFRTFVQEQLTEFDNEATARLTGLDNEIESLRMARDTELSKLIANSPEYVQIRDDYNNRIDQRVLHREGVVDADHDTRQQLSNTTNNLINDPIIEQSTTTFNKYNVANTGANIASNLFFVGSAIAFYFSAKQAAEANNEEVPDLLTAMLGTTVSQFMLDGISTLLINTPKFGTVGKAAGTVVGVFAGGAAGASAGLQIATLAEALKQDGLSDEQKAYLYGEISIQAVTLGLSVFGGAMGTIATAARAGSALANFATKAVPIVGGIVSVLTAINPAQWSYFKSSHEYIGTVEERDEYSAQYLADILGKSLTIEEGFYGATTGISVATGILTTGLALGGVTAPIAGLISLVGGVISAILQGTQQVALEAAASDMKAELEEAFGTLKDFFDESFEKQREKTLEKYVEHFDKILETTDAESVIALGSESLTASDLELAAIVKARTELKKTVHHFADRYKGDGNWLEMVFDQNKGVIKLNNTEGSTHYLMFTTPLMASGEEILSTQKTGKNQYNTILEIIGNGGWKIIDNGSANTTFNLQGGIISYENMNGVTQDLRNVIDAQGGDDAVIIGKTAITFDGGDGIDTVNYSNFDASDLGSTGLQVTSNGNRIYVTKELAAGSQYLLERIEEYKKQYGKRTETIEYRKVTSEEWDEAKTLVDELINVEVFQATEMADSLDFSNSTTIRQIFGFGGNDDIKAGQATQVISAGEGDDTIILHDGIFDRLNTFVSNEEENEDSDHLIVWGDEGYDSITLTDKWLSSALTNWQVHVLLSNFVTDGLGAETEEAKEQMLSVVNGSVGNNLAKIFSFVAFMGVEEVRVNFNSEILANSGKFGEDNIIMLSDLREAIKVSFMNKTETSSEFIVRASFANVGKWLQLVGSEENDYVIGTSYGDIIYGAAGNDRLIGGRGNDTLKGGLGDDILEGGDQQDTYYFVDTQNASGSSGDGFGHDVIIETTSYFDRDRIIIDVRYKDIDVATLFSKIGLDLLITISGESTVRYTDYFRFNFFENATFAPIINVNDSSSRDFSFTQIIEQLGLRHLFSTSQLYDKIHKLNDLITTVNSAHTTYVTPILVSPGQFIQTIYGQYDRYDIISYQNSNYAVQVFLDTSDHKTQILPPNSGWVISHNLYHFEGIIGSNFNDYLYGTHGRDYLHGGLGVDYLSGGAGDDVLYGGAGNDNIYGGFGDDIINGGAGNDVLDGSVGFDIISYEGESRAVKIDLTGPQYSYYLSNGLWYGNDNIANFEGVIGSSYNDILIGNDEDNYLVGGAGNDNIDGGSGDDIINGGAGNDVLDGSVGFDIISYEGESRAVKVDLTGSQDSHYLSNGLWYGNDNIVNFEGVIGSSHDDTIIGNSDGNYIEGASGDDMITGGGGVDVFVFNAGDGHDTLTDFDSDDILRLGSENTLKVEQEGDDTVLTIGEPNAIAFTITLTDFEASQLNMDNIYWA